jgi:outer membrane receptor protein involved in Fe transport
MTNSRKVLLACGGAIAALSLATPALAQQRNFDIPPQDASTAIGQFGMQAGLQIIAPTDQLRGVQVSGVKGELDAREALTALLRDTDLTIAQDDGRTIVLRLRPQPEGAPSEPRPVSQAATDVEEVVVTGSQIRGARITGALPVAVVSQAEIKAVGAVSGEDLYRSLPAAGDVSFNTQTLSGGSQGAARGDVSSINLRGLGPGNTLVLLNGRRIVPHAASQGFQEFTYNANSIPIAMLQRLEVLKDGAAALYGSDAVAGVVNNVLNTNFDGLTIEAQYGGAEGTNLRQAQINLFAGRDIQDGRGNLSTSLSFNHDTKLFVGDQDFTRSMDRRALVAGTSFEGNASFDTRTTTSAWGAFQVPAGTPIVRSNGVALTSAAGQFHVQPSTFAGCQLQIGGGLCIDDGNVTAAADREMRLDSNLTFPNITVTPSITRVNSFTTFNYELADNLELFTELGYYWAKSESLTIPVAPLSATPITIAANSYYNPFGPVGSPNRLPGLNIPDTGLPLTLLSYTLVDVGPRVAQVTNEQYRVLGGLRGEAFGWDWESAALFSESNVEDVADGVGNTAFQAALNRTTPDAYNPFNGGDPSSPSVGDATPSRELESFRYKAVRSSRTTLALWDFKVSNASMFEIWSGPVGAASGIEWRKETSRDNRDNYGDGSQPFIDSVTGRRHESDALGASTARDTWGERSVRSAYVEFGVPLVSPDMNVPLVRSMDLQIAGRYEDYSDVGSVAKPKIAGSWDVVDGIRLRASWSEGFKAPTLEQLVPVQRTTATQRLDDVLCEADLRARRIANFGACAQRPNVQRLVAGNADLKPEESESLSYGVVLQSTFLPPQYGRFTLTIDHWKVEQEARVSTLSAENALTLDYLMRVQGSSNPNVIRAAPTADDVAFVAGTGLAPIGAILAVQTNYENLDPRTIEGVDFGLVYALPGTTWGDFQVTANFTRTLEYFQSPSPIQQQLLDARAAGLINAASAIGGAADLLEDSGQPKWKGNTAFSWNHGPFGAGLSAQYIGRVFQNNVVNAAGEVWEVKAQLTGNAYAEFRVEGGLAADTTIRLGVRNFTNEPPPLSTQGYLGNLYQPYGRYWYASIRKSF